MDIFTCGAAPEAFICAAKSAKTSFQLVVQAYESGKAQHFDTSVLVRHIQDLTFKNAVLNYSEQEAEEEHMKEQLLEQEDAEEENKEGEDDDEDDEEQELRPSIWLPSALSAGAFPPLLGHSWFYTALFRINAAQDILRHQKNKVTARKLYRFIQAHLPVAQRLDALYSEWGSVSDKMLKMCGIKLNQLYTGLGESHYAADVRYAHIESITLERRPTPLCVLRKEYPHIEWDPSQLARLIQTDDWPHSLSCGLDKDMWHPLGKDVPVKTHTLFYAVVSVLNQCRSLMQDFWDRDEGGPVYDALWQYYA